MKNQENDMKYQIQHRWEDKVIFETKADSLKSAIEVAINRGADLKGADLRGADLGVKIPPLNDHNFISEI